MFNPKTRKFCITPKIHKENNPGRPVINSINCHASEIPRFVDHYLQPVVKEIPSYIEDTNDFVKKIKNLTVPKDSILVTMDVESLCTSIPNHEGIAAVKKRYYKCTNKAILTKIITLLALVLTLNNFILNSKFYFQIKGCAMGTRCAPTYANIFMAEFEEKYICSFIKQISVLDLIFNDDIFMIWTKSEDELKNVMKDLNTKHPSTKFDFKCSKDKIGFFLAQQFI